MFAAWHGPASRPTMDIDLLGKIDNSIEVITAVIKDACLVDVEADGISCNTGTHTLGLRVLSACTARTALPTGIAVRATRGRAEQLDERSQDRCVRAE